MKVLINEVNPGTVYKGKISDYWISGILENGKEIEIFDFIPYDLRKYVNMKVECLIIPLIADINTSIKDIKDTNLIGTYLGKYTIPSKWKKKRRSWYFKLILKKELVAIKTYDGVFIISSDYIKNFNIKKGDELYLKVGRYDLVAWHQIE